jgi:hypothetical protein
VNWWSGSRPTNTCSIEVSAFDRATWLQHFYEKVIKVKADVAALHCLISVLVAFGTSGPPSLRFLFFYFVLGGFRHISTENWALGSLRSDDWQLGRPTVPPILSVLPNSIRVNLARPRYISPDSLVHESVAARLQTRVPGTNRAIYPSSVGASATVVHEGVS